MKDSIHIQQHPLQLQNTERQTTGNQKQSGQEVVKQWMSLPTGQLVNRLLASFPSSEQTIRHMNEAQIRQIVEEVYAEINTNNITPIKETIPQKHPQTEQTIHFNKPNATMNEQEQGQLLMKSKLIDLIPEIKGEIQAMQYSDLVPFYKVVMEQYNKAINHSTTTPQAINVDQSNEELKPSEQAQRTQQKPSQSSQAISIKDIPKQTQQPPLLPLPQQVPNKQIELNFVNLSTSLTTQPQNNLKRTHQQMKESNPLTTQFNPSQLRSKLMAKLPHLSKYLTSLTPSDLQTIYHQSLLAQAQSIQKGHQKSTVSFHKSDKTETRLIQLQEAQGKGKTVVLLHTQFDPSTRIDQGIKIKQTNEGIERKTPNDTFNKIFKVLSEQ